MAQTDKDPTVALLNALQAIHEEALTLIQTHLVTLNRGR
jgi:hypothetical protein